MSQEKEKLNEHLHRQQNLKDTDELTMLELMGEIQPLVGSYNNEQKELLQDEKVQRYVQLNDLLQEYGSIVEILERKHIANIQNDCKHNLWYLLTSETDSYEGRTYWTCRCLDCDMVRESRSHNFRNVISGPSLFGRGSRHEKSYNQVQQAYRILQDKYDRYYENKQLDEDLYNDNVVGKVLKKKYR